MKLSDSANIVCNYSTFRFFMLFFCQLISRNVVLDQNLAYVNLTDPTIHARPFESGVRDKRISPQMPLARFDSRTSNL